MLYPSPTPYDIIYPQQPYLKKNIILTDSPPYIPPEKVLTMKNKYQLRELEYKYDNFVEKNIHILFLHDVLEYYLDTRDALIIQIQRLERIEQLNIYKEQQSFVDTNYNKGELYEHSFQPLLPRELRLTPIQILQGFMPCPNEPKEY